MKTNDAHRKQHCAMSANPTMKFKQRRPMLSLKSQTSCLISVNLRCFGHQIDDFAATKWKMMQETSLRNSSKTSAKYFLSICKGIAQIFIFRVLAWRLRSNRSEGSFNHPRDILCLNFTAMDPSRIESYLRSTCSVLDFDIGELWCARKLPGTT